MLLLDKCCVYKWNWIVLLKGKIDLQEVECILVFFFVFIFNTVVLKVSDHSLNPTEFSSIAIENIGVNSVLIKICNLNQFKFSKNGQTWQGIYVSLNSVNIIWELLRCSKHAAELKGTYSCLSTHMVLVERWIENLYLIQAIYSLLREIPMPGCSILQWITGKFIHPEVMYRRK